MNRRDFLNTLALGGLAALTGCAKSTAVPLPSGVLSGPNLELGHRLRDGDLPSPSESFGVEVLIVGGGVGGLSAAWKLAKSGFKDFLLVEMENKLGGNSRSGKNDVSEYPLSAHYLPLPPQSAKATRELLAELGVLQGDPNALKPRYDENYLCAVPQERLYRNGWWQEGLIPQVGVPQKELAQYQQFFAVMDEYKKRRDGGKPAFSLPMAFSSHSPDLLELDQISLYDWLLENGFDSPNLHWYLNYACRDDFGSNLKETSAWAGIHYFACRSGEGIDTQSDTVLTTPGGNAWLVEGMEKMVQERAGNRTLKDAAVFRVELLNTKKHPEYQVDLWLAKEKRAVRIRTKELIWAAPIFLIPYVFVGHKALAENARSFSYAPWIIANLTISAYPEERGGFPMAWDNVLFDGKGLGYILAAHQKMRLSRESTVLTYYRALSDMIPLKGRQLLQDRTYSEWAEDILSELSKAHPNIWAVTKHIDLYRNAHAMIRPTPGFIWGEARLSFLNKFPALNFAHADLSGMSLFEEAQYRGVLSAERVLSARGVSFKSSLQ